MTEIQTILIMIGSTILIILGLTGYLAEWFWRLVYIIDDFLPYKCHCGHWVQKRHRRHLTHTTGVIIWMCPRCYKKETSFDGS